MPGSVASGTHYMYIYIYTYTHTHTPYVGKCIWKLTSLYVKQTATIPRPNENDSSFIWIFHELLRRDEPKQVGFSPSQFLE